MRVNVCELVEQRVSESSVSELRQKKLDFDRAMTPQVIFSFRLFNDLRSSVEMMSKYATTGMSV